MTLVLACIDGSIYSHSVADHAAWAAVRLGAAVELLQVLGRREPAPADLSGSLSADAQRHLLDELATLDAERARLIQKKARLAMEEARARIVAAGVTDATVVLRHGDLLEAVAAREPTADLLVIGKRGEAADFARMHLGSNLERIVRAAHKPVLVASRAFRPVARVLIAFDGGPSALRAVDHVSRSRLFAGLAVTLATVGHDDAPTRKRLDDAAARLGAGGLSVETRIVAGRADLAIAALIESEGIDLLVMGAYGHTRIRSLFIGSTTTEMIRSCLVPLMLFR